VAATCAPDKAEKTREAISEELRKLVEQPPTEDEVARARRSLWGQYQLQQQDNEQLAHYLGLFALLGGEQGTAQWRSLPLRLAAVRPEQVQAEARQWLGAPLLVVVHGRPPAPEGTRAGPG
jgi:predicted Zn-dependent peptidase